MRHLRNITAAATLLVAALQTKPAIAVVVVWPTVS